MPFPESPKRSIALVGGTGPEGRGLALRLAKAGYDVRIGSRSPERAQSVCGELKAVLPDATISGWSNDAAAAQAEISILTIPYSAIDDTLPGLREATHSKIVVSAIAPVEFHDGRPVALTVAAGSAAQEVQNYLPGARVASGFQTVDAHQLQNVEVDLDTDVIVCSDDVEARRSVVALANSIAGIRGLSGGRLATSRHVEECTTLLVIMNRIYKSHSGLRITGIDR